MVNTICVDLDGTLIMNDVTHLSIKKFIGTSPRRLYKIGQWYQKGGKMCIKDEVAHCTPIAVQNLLYHQQFTQWLMRKKNRGMYIVLATASHQKYADTVAKYLDLFDEVFASNGERTLKGITKAEILNQRFGKNNYFYCGDAWADIPVWENSAGAILVKPAPFLLRHVKKIGIPIMASFL